ncbi:hypothetical protein CDAR_532561 [Caerostris darwini]|uniref:Uncharacterized protein n=1 Tax=Caerostris darwini TaxID=1538125 RepID=A0AAV4MKE6_9ARAC|nr:hypothetical protein CDAR_532561 [Caerostris darwini]
MLKVCQTRPRMVSAHFHTFPPNVVSALQVRFNPFSSVNFVYVFIKTEALSQVRIRLILSIQSPLPLQRNHPLSQLKCLHFRYLPAHALIRFFRF